MSSLAPPPNEPESVDQQRILQTLKVLQSAKGHGTSLITFILPAGWQIALAHKKLRSELSLASNVKTPATRKAITESLAALMNRLALHRETPPNGLALFSGTALVRDSIGNEDERRVCLDVALIKPAHGGLFYRCDDHFHTDVLETQIVRGDKYGFIIADGKGAVFATLEGDERKVLHRFSVDLPNKHNKGGQSSARARHNYLRKLSETAADLFLKENQVTVKGLVVAGSADIKTELCESLTLDPRLKRSIIGTIDVAYGGIPGLHEAISKAAPVVENLKLVADSELIASFFEEVAKDAGQVAVGLNETLRAIELKAISKLICWSDLHIIRTVLKNSRDIDTLKTADECTNSEEKVVFTQSGANADLMLDSEFDFVGEQTPLTAWIIEKHRIFGLDPSQVHFVSDQSSEGAQFCRSFGIGAILHYHIDWSAAMEHHSPLGDDATDDISTTLAEFE